MRAPLAFRQAVVAELLNPKTALFFLAPDEAADGAPGVHCVRMTTDGRLRATAGFPGELFTVAA